MRLRKDGVSMKQGWLAVAGICLLAAAAFWWRGFTDATFVAAALGVLAWFLNVRSQLRRKFPDEEETDEDFDAPTEEQYRER
ncbi:MAG: hypothetical protein H0T60_09750 [Acidobacteria bacterium]|nr:hypothetical protein [Acidobacteriota bacterium]